MSRPTCLHCGLAIRKATRMIDVESAAYRPQDSEAATWSKGYVRGPVSGREAAKAIADRYGCDVTSITKHKSGDVWSFNVWDRKTYAPRYGFFCSNHCAGQFAHYAARDGVRIKGGHVCKGGYGG